MKANICDVSDTHCDITTYERFNQFEFFKIGLTDGVVSISLKSTFSFRICSPELMMVHNFVTLAHMKVHKIRKTVRNENFIMTSKTYSTKCETGRICHTGVLQIKQCKGQCIHLSKSLEVTNNFYLVKSRGI